MSNAMVALTEFGFESSSIRVLGTKYEPWFVGKDVCEALGYTNPRKAIADHVDEEDKNTVTIRDGTSGNPNMTIINESGLYSLIFGSKLASAKAFKRFVTHEVLPSIRRYGYYKAPEQPKQPKLPQTPLDKYKQYLALPYPEQFKEHGKTGQKHRLANGEELTFRQIRFLCCDLGAEAHWAYNKSNNFERITFINNVMTDRGYATVEEALIASKA